MATAKIRRCGACARENRPEYRSAKPIRVQRCDPLYARFALPQSLSGRPESLRRGCTPAIHPPANSVERQSTRAHWNSDHYAEQYPTATEAVDHTIGRNTAVTIFRGHPHVPTDKTTGRDSAQHKQPAARSQGTAPMTAAKYLNSAVELHCTRTP